MAAFVLALAQVSYFLLVGWIFGASVQGGVPGVMLVLLLGGLSGMAFASIGLSIAFRARQASIVQGLFPFVFVVLYLSSAFFPRSLLQEPASTMRRLNPLSYLADGLRTPIVFWRGGHADPGGLCRRARGDSDRGDDRLPPC